MFTTPKRNGDLCLTFNLRDLNYFVPHVHFKMENISLLKDLLLPQDWMVKVDLRDAYYTVPIHEESQDFLRLAVVGGQAFQVHVPTFRPVL